MFSDPIWVISHYQVVCDSDSTLSTGPWYTLMVMIVSPQWDDLLPGETLVVLSSKFVIDQLSCLDRRMLLMGMYTFVHYISACTNHVTIALWEYSKVSVVLPSSSFVSIYVRARRNVELQVLLLIASLHFGSRHCIIGYEWTEHCCCVRDTQYH